MHYVKLGRTGLMVSPLCLGTMNFGPTTSEQDSHTIMDKALDMGINFFDTADVYGWKKGEGVTEQIVGRWLAKGGGRRERIVLATKVYNVMGDGPNDRGLSAYHLRQACDASLRRLKTDHIDLYQMHHIDRNTPLEEIWQAMEQLTRQGKIIYVGSSNFPAWYIAQANTLAAGRNFLGLVCEQCLYNLTNRTVELEVLPAAEALGLAVIPWSPLSSGLLGGILKWSDSQSDRQRAKSRRNQQSQLDKLERYRPQLEKWEQFCDQSGSQPAAVALAWLLANPVVTAPIIGPRTIEQLTDSLEALDVKLDDDAMKRLDDIWPGPGGAAPEAYSW